MKITNTEITPQVLDDMDCCIRNCEFWRNANEENYGDYRRLMSNFNIAYRIWIRIERR